MYISSITISKYRSCLRTTIRPKPGLSSLIGVNSAGKTNLLNGILLLKKAAASQLRFYPRKQYISSRSHVSAIFNINGRNLLYRSNLLITPEEGNKEIVVSAQSQ